MKVQLVQETARHKRKVRSPRIDVSHISWPYQIAPVAFHPVLPGETLKSLWYNLSFASDPLGSRWQTGWIDVAFFYVKHSQLDMAADLIAMHVDGITLPNAGAAARLGGQSLPFLGAAGGVNYVKACYDLVVKWYFRDSDEPLTPESGLIGPLQPAQIQRDGWWQSAKLAAVNPVADDLLPGQYPEQPDENINQALYTEAYTQWARMRSLGLTEATYEDYLAAQGVRATAENDEELKRPELLARNGEFVMPSQAVEPSTGYTRTAHVKMLKGRTEKPKYFREPGFIIGVQVWRPKVFLGNVKGTMSGFMDRPEDWLPASLSEHAYTSVKGFAEGTGPAPVQTNGDSALWVDLRDLLLYGEQQCNFIPNEAASDYHRRATALFAPSLPRPGTADSKYLTEAEARGVFLAPNEFTVMRSEGIVSFSIDSQIGSDTTP